jgi:hypothetical protein
VWLSLYYTADVKKHATYLRDKFLEVAQSCIKRGWTVVGGITDNASYEIKSMEMVKKSGELGPAFANLRCGMHTANLLMQDVLMIPSKKRGQLCAARFTSGETACSLFTTWPRSLSCAPSSYLDFGV